MYWSQVSPVSIAFILWLSWPCQCQYDPYGGSPFYGEPDPYSPYFNPPPPGGPLPQAQQPQPQQAIYPPLSPNLNNNNFNTNLFNPFLPTGQQSQTQQSQQQLLQQQQQQLQQLQGSYPNLPSVPFQTVTPGGNNPLQRVDKYPFPGTTLGNVGANNNNNNLNNLNSNLQQQQSNALFNQQYPKVPDFPFQTISPGQYPPPSYNPPLNGINPPANTYKPRIELPKIRVIEFPSTEFFEYGGGKLVTPKRPNSDLYIGGSGGDVPITSKVFIECTGPNQVEWLLNGTETYEKKPLSTVTKNFQITIPEDRGPTPGSREYTYLRLGLEEQVAEKDSGVYICRDRILPQNYITIRILVAKPTSGKPNYPFTRPKDPNTIYYSQRDRTVVLPCKIENADATISLHKHENGKLSCPYSLDGRVTYDRFKGFILQTQSFKNIEGRYVCVGDFGGDLRLMKYRLVNSEDFTTRYVEGEAQNVIALDGQKKSGDSAAASSSSTFLAEVDPVSNSFSSGLSKVNLTAAGLLDPRSEFDIVKADEASFPPKKSNNQTDNTSDSGVKL